MSNRTVMMNGNPVEIVGNVVSVGDKAPDFNVVAMDFSIKRLADFSGKVCILSAVPSLDTGTCDIETRKFNELAAGLGNDIQVITISVDLPFAQRRWCGAAGIDRVTVLSDHRKVSFGENYGILMKNARQLARAIFIVDKSGVIRYTQLVPEIGNEPNYDEVIDAAKALV